MPVEHQHEQQKAKTLFIWLCLRRSRSSARRNITVTLAFTGFDERASSSVALHWPSIQLTSTFWKNRIAYGSGARRIQTYSHQSIIFLYVCFPLIEKRFTLLQDRATKTKKRRTNNAKRVVEGVLVRLHYVALGADYWMRYYVRSRRYRRWRRSVWLIIFPRLWRSFYFFFLSVSLAERFCNFSEQSGYVLPLWFFLKRCFAFLADILSSYNWWESFPSEADT